MQLLPVFEILIVNESVFLKGFGQLFPFTGLESHFYHPVSLSFSSCSKPKLMSYTEILSQYHRGWKCTVIDATQIRGETELPAFARLQLNCFPASVWFIRAVISCHSTFTTLV